MIVYSFGCRAPIAGVDAGEEQLLLAHRYYNTLIEVERRRRACIHRYRERFLPADLVAEEARLSTVVDDAVCALRQKRSGLGRRADVSAEIAALEAAKVALLPVRQRLRDARTAVRADVRLKGRLHRIDQAARNVVKMKRAASGVYWGTYLQVEEAVEQAKEPPKRPQTPGKPPTPWHELPRFRRWEGEGKLAVQLQGGASIEDILITTEMKRGDTRLQIERVSDDEWFRRQGKADKVANLSKATGRRANRRGFVRVRVGSNPDRSPVWIEAPVVLHRVPDRGMIKWAWLLRRRVGPKFEWSLQLVVDDRPADGLSPAPKVGHRVALDIGWRRKEPEYASLRVGYWRGSDGSAGEILLPATHRDDLEHVDHLRQIRDDARDVAVARLRHLLSSLTSSPDWLKVATANLERWRNGRRLADLVRLWADRRFSGDAEVFDYLVAWEKQDRHLWQWEANRRQRILRHRREVYRVAAAALSKRYAELVLGKFDLRKVAEEPAPEEGVRGDGHEQRRSRTQAAPHELRGAFENAFRRDGGRIVSVSDVNKTQRCHLCGSEESWDAAPSHLHTCGNCGVSWDQDDNHCRNLLASAEATTCSPEALAGGSTDDKNTKKEPGRRARKRQRTGRSQNVNESAETNGDSR